MTATPGLRIVSSEPLNAEAPLEALSGVVPRSELHFVRSHFAFPAHPGTLTIGGEARRPMVLTLDALRDRASSSVANTLECAGNGRAFLDPPAPGEPWRLGAVGTAEWTGVMLRDLLAEAEVTERAVEILFRGADLGEPAGLGRTIAFERSLRLPVPADVIVALEMNGRPLAREYGAPFRLIVPGWYGMASVKWLTEIVAIATPFRGFYQADRYVIGDAPLDVIAPRALIVAPADGARVPARPSVIRGYAWSGRTSIDRVDVSTDGGETWAAAELGKAVGRAWRTWETGWKPVPGVATLLARATNARGERQPLEQVRNALGYGNNAAQPVLVEVVPAD